MLLRRMSPRDFRGLRLADAVEEDWQVYVKHTIIKTMIVCDMPKLRTFFYSLSSHVFEHCQDADGGSQDAPSE